MSDDKYQSIPISSFDEESQQQLLRIQLGEPEVGMWCNTCALPSAYTVKLYTLADDGPRELGTVQFCEGCGDVP